MLFVRTHYFMLVIVLLEVILVLVNSKSQTVQTNAVNDDVDMVVKNRKELDEKIKEMNKSSRKVDLSDEFSDKELKKFGRDETKLRKQLIDTIEMHGRSSKEVAKILHTLGNKVSDILIFSFT